MFSKVLLRSKVWLLCFVLMGMMSYFINSTAYAKEVVPLKSSVGTMEANVGVPLNPFMAFELIDNLPPQIAPIVRQHAVSQIVLSVLVTPVPGGNVAVFGANTLIMHYRICDAAGQPFFFKNMFKAIALFFSLDQLWLIMIPWLFQLLPGLGMIPAAVLNPIIHTFFIISSAMGYLYFLFIIL